jgi:hemolysin D
MSLYTLRLQSFKKGEAIFTEGSRSGEAFIVQSGSVNILKSGSNQQPVVLKTLEVGEMFGEMALVTNNPRAASAFAKTDVMLEVINRNAFGLKMQHDPEFAMQTVRRLAGMVPEAQSRLLARTADEDAVRGEKQELKGLFRKRKSLGSEVDAFAPDYIQIVQEPVPSMVRYAGLAIAAMLICVVLWASFAFTDTTVSGAGRVATTVPNILVQPFDNGIVRQVNVKTGQLVKRGDVLARLDPTLTAADLKSTQLQMLGIDAQIARIRAELAGKGAEVFSPDPTENNLQRQLFDARTQQFQSTLLAHNEEIRNLSEQALFKRNEAVDIEKQLVVLREITRAREELYKKERDIFQRDGQFRFQYLDAQRTQSAAERDKAQIISAANTLEVQNRTKRAQRDAFVSDWTAKNNLELVSALREQSRLAETYKKVDRANTLIDITAPSDAIVLSVKVGATGSVVRSAEALFELVPIDVPLEVEIDISPRDVGPLQPNDHVTVKLDALPFVKHGTISGKLRLISEDTFEKTLTGQPGPVYRGYVTIGALGLTDTPPNFRLLPGMTVTGDVKTGSRRLVTFITYPVTRALSTSFREP